MKTTGLISVLALSLAACGGNQPAPQQTAAIADAAQPIDQAGSADARAEHAMQAFTGRLQATLKDAISQQGAVAAIDVCQQQAPQIAAEIAAEHDVRIGRVPVAARGRNPHNSAAGWQLDALAAFEAAHAAGQPAADLIFSQRDGLPGDVALRVMKGLETQPACLACHGKQLAAPVHAALATHYPNDAATGFAAGDLRGAVWVEGPAK
ncbi:MAG: DUF3365 domain-containing protein [Pseudomonadota bacterium]|nr:DUF3365 domain-containing protein [Pseudomonadota bacterium]